ncbi:MAG TPA: 50S ribosomal protein L25 [Bacteroidales bacterium]|nr:50S ribosomal protein L25 [Bacteroidales bacterium]
MKKVSMSGSLRENVGKKDAKAQRKAGNVVCVLYGGEGQISFTLPLKKFEKIIFTPDIYVVDLEISGKVYTAILKEVQYHPVTDSILHADFYQVFEDKAVTINIPLKFTGTSPGVIAGGKLVSKIRKIGLKGLIKDIPENVEINISALKVGMSIRIKDINLDNLTLTDNPNNVVVSVNVTRGVVITEEEAAAE